MNKEEISSGAEEDLEDDERGTGGATSSGELELDVFETSQRAFAILMPMKIETRATNAVTTCKSSGLLWSAQVGFANE